jgi:hypothetical protein
MPFAYIKFIENPDDPTGGRPSHPIAPGGRPVDPDWGIDEGGRPTHPIAPGGRPGHLPSWGGNRPGGERPSHPIAPGGRPVDPGWGVEEEGGGSAGQLPVWPVAPDQGLPPVPGYPLPPIDPPPGTVWPPLPPSVPEGKVIALVAISGIGYRYTVLTVPPPAPDQGLPTDRPDRPDQGLPRPPGHPDQGLPNAPVRPDQGLPPSAQPKARI